MEALSTNVNHDIILSKLFVLLKTLPGTWESLEDAKNSIHNVIQQTYTEYLVSNSINHQNNAGFKTFLFTSLEQIIMATLHEQIFGLIRIQFEAEDEMIYKKCKELSLLKVTADQLGAMEDYAIPLPAAVVELASLDMHSSPTEKFTCLSTTFDLVLAELKGAIVDIIAHTADSGIPVLNVADITPILTTVIIHAKPLHLFSNMYYVENFRWSENSISDCECILAVKTAIDKLRVITIDMLHQRSARIYCDIGLEDVFKITSNVDSKFDSKGRRLTHPANPLERYIENFTGKIAAATLTNINS